MRLPKNPRAKSATSSQPGQGLHDYFAPGRVTNTASRTTADREDGPKTFLGLPAEIRNIIYEMALKVDDGRTGHFQIRDHNVVHGATAGGHEQRRATERPALLAVNRQLRREAMPVFYAINSFAATVDGFDSEEMERLNIRSWLRAIGTRQAAMIKTFRVLFYNHDHYLARCHTQSWFRASGRPMTRISLCASDIIEVLGLEELGVAPKGIEVKYDDDTDGKTWHKMP